MGVLQALDSQVLICLAAALVAIVVGAAFLFYIQSIKMIELFDLVVVEVYLGSLVSYRSGSILGKDQVTLWELGNIHFQEGIVLFLLRPLWWDLYLQCYLISSPRY
ncbi:hypothetical protein E5676_scaffold590G00100 [Cucumis melo var. makuwa]|uniref:Uncharacterized protein n=1 Tax=Cucumis melo var. makuwa TaxID=1194695 RepID=A0A5D3DA14_CUCMM|nr:hypothetical protein E6C27_scaffold845G00330 [Cucumis melo var. makuwa]TYK20417.1 hypothetical protein E5676_scaffold590G00100 [Cucumis melo var. makuwa]